MNTARKIQMPDGTISEAIPRPDNISLFPSRGVAKDADEHKSSYIRKWLTDIGFIAMSNTQPKTPGFYINWSTISGVILILSTIIGGWLYTYNATWNAAYQKGLDDAEKKIILERLTNAEKDGKQAKDLQLLNDKSHPSPTPEKKK